MKKILLYTAPDGSVPFLRFLDVTDEKMRNKLLYALKCLILFPERMTEPYVKHFSIERYKDLYELRERIRILVRIIFTLDKDGNIIILHPFVKRHDRNKKKVLMLDELWCLIGASSNPLAADYVLEIFKVMRGYGGSAVCATQDLNDFFALEGGKDGKGIINNSRIKVVLPLEEDEALRVKDVLGLSDEETLQIIRNRRGEGLLCAGHNRISVAFQPTQMEYDMITTSRSDLEEQMQRNEQAARD